MSAPELLVVALEASADLHGASVLRELKGLRPELRAFGAGGPRMRAEGFEALVRAEDISVMGVAEVLPALPRILEAMDQPSIDGINTWFVAKATAELLAGRG